MDMSWGATEMHRARFALMAVVAVALLIQALPYSAAAMTCTPFQSNLSQDWPIVFEGLWYSADNSSARPLASNSVIEGDRIVLVGTFYNEDLTQPVIRTECNLVRGILFEKAGDLLIPTPTYNPFSGTVNLTEFAWVFVYGIGEGDNVRVSVDFSNGDCDVVGWWAATDNTTWTYGNNLLADQMTTGAKPELGSFVAHQGGTLAVGVFDNDNSTGTFEVIVDTSAGFEIPSVSGAEIELRTTDYLDCNERVDITFLGWVDGNNAYKADYRNITVVNYFAPKVSWIVVSGEAPMITFQWTIHDRNALDIHTSDILVSIDDGVTFQWIARDLDSMSYTWDSTGFIKEWYYGRIMVYDSHGIVGSADFGPFFAGTWTHGVPTTVVPTTTSGQGTTGPGVMSQLGIVITLASSAVILTVLVLWTRARPRRTGT